ncbi:hypothetical protein [Sediminicoccus sp. BL-A-41-H5]|uniref:hypothetical protein n=1 Tax=Sediminicoccus sp. BL-A-41-H5 TaxID=3421106 RepID=UPI003D666D78
MSEKLVPYQDVRALVARAPFRSIVAPRRMQPGEPMPPVLGVSFHDGEITPEVIRATVDAVGEVFAAGGCHLLLATDRSTRERLKAAILATHPAISQPGGVMQ